MSFMRGKSGERGRLAHPKWQLELCCQLHEHSRQDLSSAEFPSFQRRRARGRKREAQRHTQQHHSWSWVCATRVLCLPWSSRQLKQQPQIWEKQQEFIRGIRIMWPLLEQSRKPPAPGRQNAGK